MLNNFLLTFVLGFSSLAMIYVGLVFFINIGICSYCIPRLVAFSVLEILESSLLRYGLCPVLFLIAF